MTAGLLTMIKIMVKLHITLGRITASPIYCSKMYGIESPIGRDKSQANVCI